MISRCLTNQIKQNLFKQKAIIITGPRQSGKTTLMDLIVNELNTKFIFLNCDEPDIRKKLTDATSVQLKTLIGNNKIVCIDEAQRIENIGITLKLIVDNFKDVQLIVSGSSSLDLAGKGNEPLTGGKFEYFLMPFMLKELIDNSDELTQNRLLENRMIYGMYPDVVNNSENQEFILKNIVNSYLFKDIFTFQDIRKPEIIEKLVEALALQIGSEVSYNELAQIVGIDFQTVTRYLDLLEKSHIIFKLRAFSRNVRNEIKKSRKIYFVDTGIRNAIIANFNPLNLRQDAGALWENFLISERRKFLLNHTGIIKPYFWRTTQQQEIDYIEERNAKLFAYEIKLNENAKVKFPETFSKNYENTEYQILNPENYIDFLTNFK